MSPETSSRKSSRFSFDQESVLVSDSRSNSITLADATPVSSTPFILYPEITVVPEVDSIDLGDEASIWVAVVITGGLRKTTGYNRVPSTLLTPESCGTSQDRIKLGEQAVPQSLVFTGIDLVLREQ